MPRTCELGARAAKNPAYENIGFVIAAEMDPECPQSGLSWTVGWRFTGSEF